MLPTWAQAVIGIAIAAIFVFAVIAMAGGGYGDWVREFYAKRDKLTTIFGDDDKHKSKSE
jgi:hypothetical protein